MMSSVNLSIIHPRLLSTLVLFEPLIQSSVPQGIFYAFHSDNHRDLWPSRAVAEAAFRTSKPHSTWDPRVLHWWFEYGLRATPTALYPDCQDGSITLATSKHQETWTYVRPYFDPLPVDSAQQDRERYPDIDPKLLLTHPFYRAEPGLTLSALPCLRPSVLYVFSNTSPISTPEMQDEKMRLTGVGVGGSGGAIEGKVEKVVMSDTGHLLTMKAPEKCAAIAADWLRRWQEKYRDIESKAQRGTSMKSERGGLIVSEEWQQRTTKWMGQTPARPKAPEGPGGKTLNCLKACYNNIVTSQFDWESWALLLFAPNLPTSGIPRDRILYAQVGWSEH